MLPGLYPSLADSLQNQFYFAFEWERAPDWNFTEYQIPAMTIWHILDGYRALHVRDEQLLLQPGDLLVLPNQSVITTRHAETKGPSRPFHYLSLGLQFTIGAREWPELYGIPIRMRPDGREELVPWLELWRQLARRYALQLRSPASDAAALAAASSATEYLEWGARYGAWLAGLNRIVQPFMAEPEPRTDERLFRICSFIQAHYAAPLTAKEIARYACLSEGHLRAIFRRSLHMSPYQYVLHTRLTKAKQLLITSNQTLLEIAAAVGFDDVSHFISLFKRKIGATPAQYRKKANWSV
ncbi:AraC family transcriptional regulator [Paenibacillus arenilitoris]|uniref:Helix-turn-helix transcriptional regulator n=1 Tax=Paenibacillus arenilitoris TaxID=2772299 RepID=A0A927CLY6_9BACL|nr:AraC family transcriptional regulator [Paenibacillus arenilitoris]MBD2869018.1 helix-turn-helix transcriptional regulator [Paenibacillus arenilitoris]